MHYKFCLNFHNHLLREKTNLLFDLVQKADFNRHLFILCELFYAFLFIHADKYQIT